MAYLKPPSFLIRFANPLAMRLGGSRVTTLVVSGRKSGEPRAVPLAPILFEGTRYLVSARGETEWVRNLRQAKQGELRSRGVSTPIAAEEVPAAERQAILAAYKSQQGAAVAGLFRKLPNPEDHPVFKIS